MDTETRSPLAETLDRRTTRRDVLRMVAGAALVAPTARFALPPSSAASAYSADVLTNGIDLALALLRDTAGFTPPVVSRAIGYTFVSVYEALVPGMPDRRRVAGVLNDLSPLSQVGRSGAYHWPTVASSALAESLRRLVPGASTLHGADLERYERRAAGGAPRGMRERSVRRGREVAAAIAAWARTDGGHDGHLRNFPPDYVPPDGLGSWAPTPPDFQPALQPYWGSNRCFLLADGGDCWPAPPPAFSNDPGSPFFAEALEVYDAVRQLTPEQDHIARFWADDPGVTATPPGHSLSILGQVLAGQEAALDEAAEAAVRLGIAVSDAFVACWRSKYAYNLVRPITYIREHIDPAWGDPLPVATPPFPEYTSGHSVQSGAAATVLTATFGPIGFTDRTHEARGLGVRAFDSFAAAADEAAISRLYGGIHYRSAIDVGLAQGRCIGAKVAALDLRA